MSIKLVMPSNHLILCNPLLLLPSIFPRIRVFSSESALRIRWLKYWSFSFSLSPSNEYSGLISFKIDWFDLLAVQGTLKGLLQKHNLEAPILPCSAFFRVHFTSVHDYGRVVCGETVLRQADLCTLRTILGWMQGIDKCREDIRSHLKWPRRWRFIFNTLVFSHVHISVSCVYA